MPSARGSFEVNIEPEPPYLEDGGVKLNLNRVEKQYSGDMVGSARAHMLAAYTTTPGSAGYVAIEHFSGTVNGKSGSLALQHSGTMDRGEASLTVTVVPDSGTGELAGIAGTLELNSEEAGHTYVFEYELA
ncbi:MAG: DUF3224 domain-containing protein [Chloroflexi bacterium]|nr:DUF3224 domain-containing protein [Chloroflexota bacterium]MDE2702375.1 DUF3224 domain-containing protein [Chloroflexota bacterium]MDE2935995.1 DUF3224 domain-containing protein [Chloroflexota bacterium]MXY00622.1 DUF3224 domain-containing protein [Chloroflexota bacterium]MXY13390.1 DUF3224 domain-containing protein [Chloroflexota bacterium]